MAAVHELAEQRRRAGQAVGIAFFVSAAALAFLLFEANGRRIERGHARLWYRDVQRRSGLGRSSNAHTMRLFRRHGLLAGRPCEADPTNNFLRDRADYVATVPVECAQTYGRLGYRLRERAKSAAAAFEAGVSAVRTRVTPATHNARLLPKSEIDRQEMAPPVPGDNPPAPPPGRRAPAWVGEYVTRRLRRGQEGGRAPP
jgi:hypothetical protein